MIVHFDGGYSIFVKDKYVEACPMPVLEVLPLIEEIRISRVKGKTLFEMANISPHATPTSNNSNNLAEDPLINQNDYICNFYLNIADQLLTEPEGVIPRELADKELFTLLSDFYLKV